MPDGGQLIRIWPPTLYSIKWPGNAMSDREADLTSSALDRGGRKAARRRLGLPPHEAVLSRRALSHSTIGDYALAIGKPKARWVNLGKELAGGPAV